jgi:hypothetical protein
MSRVNGKLAGTVHLASRHKVVDVDAVVVQIPHFTANVDFQIFGVVQSQTINSTLGIDKIVPKRLTIASKATDNANP